MINIFLSENIFLLIIAFIWLVGAIILDFKKLEVDNWWNFSLIVIGLAYRGFLSVSNQDYRFILWGVIGLSVLFIVSEIFYYSRIFAMGDEKLLFALGVILPISLNWKDNLVILLVFIIAFFLSASVYGLIYTLILSFVNRKSFVKEFKMLFKKYKNIFLWVVLAGFSFFAIGVLVGILPLMGVGIMLVFGAILLLYGKAVENASMFRKVKVDKLVCGDWVAERIKIGNRVIKVGWEGIDEKDLSLIKKNYKKLVLVKYGIAFTPAFLIALILTLLWFWFVF